jgi:hypothetical protein
LVTAAFVFGAGCTVGADRGFGVKSGLAPLKTVDDGVPDEARVELGFAPLVACWVTVREFAVGVLDAVPPQVPLAVKGWLKVMSKCSV